MNTHGNRKQLSPTQQAAMGQLAAAVDKLEADQEIQDGALRDLHGLIAMAIKAQSADTASLATAASVERNYIDQIRISSGLPRLREMPNYGREVPAAETSAVLSTIVSSAARHAAAVARVREAMDERNKLIVAFYRGDVLGPSRIAEASRVDRNHIMRINRSAPGWTPRPRSMFGAKAAKRTALRRAVRQPDEKPVVATVPSTNPFSG